MKRSSNAKGLLDRILKPRAPVAASAEAVEYLTVPADTTFFHITHWKAGSQWMQVILDDLFGPLIIPAQYFELQVLGKPIESGKLYTCVYLGKPEFDSLAFGGKHRQFVLVRDLRDTLISSYFSFRNSHALSNTMMEKFRYVLTKVSTEEGIMYMMETWLGSCADIQRTWARSGERCYRLEDFMNSDSSHLRQLLESSFGISIDEARLKAVVAARSFEKLAGRKPGSEDLNSHYRKGVHGDWQNHFTPAIKDRFKYLFNDALVQTGYEKDANW
ncbi:MAG: transporter related protein [Verrucomicrobiales bacterium]|nr:transporter related protein [Verrucomicrobiales bacterium]